MWGGSVLFSQYAFYRVFSSVRGAAVQNAPSAKHPWHRLNHDALSVDQSPGASFISEMCSRLRSTRLHACTFNIPFDFSNLWPISDWMLVCGSHSTLLMYLRIGEWNLAYEIWAHYSNWYPTGYYRSFLNGWWSSDWLITWKVQLWTWWARQGTQVNPGKCLHAVTTAETSDY